MNFDSGRVGASPGEDTTMARIADRPPVRLMVLARLITLLNWASDHRVEWGSLIAATWIVIVRAFGEQWWVAGFCGALFGVIAVLCLPSTVHTGDDRR
jgi:hypothetical protein